MKSIAEIVGNQTPTFPSSSNEHGVYNVGYRLTQDKQYQCDKCQDREIVIIDGQTAIPCDCKAKKAVSRRLRASGLTKEQLSYKIEDYKLTDKNKMLLEGTKRYLQSWTERIGTNSPNKGFCMVGSVGIGKTMLSSIIAKDMLDKGIPVVFISSTDLMAELRQAQFTEDNGIESKIDTLANAPALILDDVGKEKPTEWVQSMYYRLIDLRYRNNLLTGFTSNYYPKQLQDRLGEFGNATVSRLLGMAKDFILVSEADDWRIK